MPAGPVADMDDVLSADTIILAIPVGEIVEWLHTFGPSVGPGTLVMDTGSAKHGVVEAMRRTIPDHAHALGGHPIAGTELPGPVAADPRRLEWRNLRPLPGAGGRRGGAARPVASRRPSARGRSRWRPASTTA